MAYLEADAVGVSLWDPFCDECGRSLDGDDPCRGHIVVSPGPQPCAAEVQDQVKNGWARAHAAFEPYELSLARDSARKCGGCGSLFLDGPIDGNAAFWFGRRLDALKAAGAGAAVVVVNSSGGDVVAGLAMIRALEKFSATVGPAIAWVKGFAGSMASVVAVSADYCVADPMAQFFVHEASGGTPEHLTHLQAKLLSIYEARTLVSRAAIEGWAAGAVTLDAFTAHSHGFVDEVAWPDRVEEIARAAATIGGLWSSPIRAANSWRRHVLRERSADAQGVTRF